MKKIAGKIRQAIIMSIISYLMFNYVDFLFFVMALMEAYQNVPPNLLTIETYI